MMAAASLGRYFGHPQGRSGQHRRLRDRASAGSAITSSAARSRASVVGLFCLRQPLRRAGHLRRDRRDIHGAGEHHHHRRAQFRLPEDGRHLVHVRAGADHARADAEGRFLPLHARPVRHPVHVLDQQDGASRAHGAVHRDQRGEEGEPHRRALQPGAEHHVARAGHARAERPRRGGECGSRASDVASSRPTRCSGDPSTRC